MRAFIILGFLAAAASASVSGINYEPAISGSIRGVYNGAIFGNGGEGLIENGGIGTAYQTYTSGIVGTGSELLDNEGDSHVVSSGGATVVGLNGINEVPTRVELNKQFFHFSAPEEEQDAGVINQQVSNVLKKNLQVVFIKAPENNAATNAALQVAKQAIEQKTAIYVLSKENDANQVIGTLQQIQENVPTTPEVRIIKYRTQEDLANARNTIQAQYENIGGSSQVIDGGVAPVLNYATRNLLGGANYVATNAANLGANYIATNAADLGASYVAANSADLGANYDATNADNLGVDYVAPTGAIPVVSTESIESSKYLPPSPLKK